MKFEETYLNDNILDALYDMHLIISLMPSMTCILRT